MPLRYLASLAPRTRSSDEPAVPPINAERIRAVYAQIPLTLTTPVVVAILAAAVLLRVANPISLLLSFGSIVVITAMRFALWIAYRRAAPRHESAPVWGFATSAGSAMTGIAWGLGAALLFPSDPAYQLFLGFIIGGLCAGAVTVNSAHLPSVLVFIWPATMPLALRFFQQGSALDVAAGGMTVVFAFALSLTAQRFHSSFGGALKLQLELEDRTRDLYASNARLQAEMAEHQATEASLRQAQKMEAVGRLTAGMAHDFNNLLMVIGGSVELLQAKLGPHDRYASHLTTISETAERGAVLTRQLLAFARQQALKPRPTDLNALVRDMAPLLTSVVGGKSRIDLRLAPDLWSAHVDRGQIEHAIMNLVINGRDAMEDGGGVVTIETGNVTVADADRSGRLAPGEYVSVVVADTGCGMSEEVLAQAFDPFFSTKDPGKGSGLGLSQVYGIIQQSGGATDIESARDHGTRVRLYLPKAGDARSPKRGQDANASDGTLPTPAKSRILLIDSDAHVRETIASALRGAGHEVIAADNTVRALRLLQTEIAPDLAILDPAIPEGTGELLAQLIRQRFAGIPIAFVTDENGTAPFDGERWLLPKPVSTAALLDLVSQALRGRDHFAGSDEHA